MKTTFLAIFVCMFAFFGTFIYALPDAQIVSAITYAPTTIVSGDTVTFTANFRITDEAVTNFKVEGGIDGAILYTRTYSSITAGATRTMSFTWTATGGTHVAYFKLDPSNSISESDEANNLKELSLEISGVQNQTDLNFNVGPQITPWDQLFTGTSLNIKAQVYNHNTIVNNVKIKVTIDSIQVWQTTVAQMTANSYYWIDFNWTATIGSHTLNILIDPDNTITESNETNNEWSLPFTVTDAPQAPDPSELTDIKYNGNISVSPFTPQEGDPQVVKVRIYNASNLTVNNIKIEGGMDAVKMHEAIIASMNAYSLKDVQFTWTAAVPGSHTAYFKIDPDNSIAENNETNNSLTFMTNVTAKPVGPTPGQPCDPQWRDAGIAGVGAGVQKPQQNIRLRNVIKNTGNTAVNLKVTAGVGDKTLKDEVFPTFVVGQESNFFFDWKPITGGKHTVWFQIDPGNEQNDTNRNNNRVERVVEVSELQLSTSPAGLEAKFNQESDPCESNSSVTPDVRLVSFTQKAPYEKERAYFSIGIKNESDRCIKGLGIGIYSDTISVGGPALKFWVNSEGKISTSPYSLGGTNNKWFLKGKETKTISYHILAADVTGKTDCVIAAAGNASGVCQKLKAKVDFEDNITESDENNNASPFKVFSWKK